MAENVKAIASHLSAAPQTCPRTPMCGSIKCCMTNGRRLRARQRAPTGQRAMTTAATALTGGTRAPPGRVHYCDRQALLQNAVRGINTAWDKINNAAHGTSYVPARMLADWHSRASPIYLSGSPGLRRASGRAPAFPADRPGKEPTPLSGSDKAGWSDSSSDGAKPGLQDHPERADAPGPGPRFSGAQHLQSGETLLEGTAAGKAGLIPSAIGTGSALKITHDNNNNNTADDDKQLQ
ncbi:hypothetical protein SKAU_G00003620 [Synaphobranchus kaupii]|uniref:Uncharacterized protein n=1 Tax=Synaphobranchus kaupii TaxID=118154 RepID=A0A9Q1G9V4_SYNKA|nr:hypothetical protein SKAU_G00003620 [Synaphobranchus kaupii]